ncbi:uncharacterized protein BP01DRAFT_193129 [Aspergillus saccharolyticus JOP 1030-1]|uniref:Secreted protein n=1 Tax=Aspergillus saccharolyticus JOP 1030-1 TaxID=1450539 RepID=A0A318ZKP5_9EURO|nr:hypothetical protein BP01DRAFT_193129 [Aspergillus saccharolyticus JOP 1030-1]PYH40808.1 hypothetical protein BP01DRAFT_193129 [Aspergillus saccharolyticus JOP 1030-1]
MLRVRLWLWFRTGFCSGFNFLGAIDKLRRSGACSGRCTRRIFGGSRGRLTSEFFLSKACAEKARLVRSRFWLLLRLRAFDVADCCCCSSSGLEHPHGPERPDQTFLKLEGERSSCQVFFSPEYKRSPLQDSVSIKGGIRSAEGGMQQRVVGWRWPRMSHCLLTRASVDGSVYGVRK